MARARPRGHRPARACSRVTVRAPSEDCRRDPSSNSSRCASNLRFGVQTRCLRSRDRRDRCDRGVRIPPLAAPRRTRRRSVISNLACEGFDAGVSRGPCHATEVPRERRCCVPGFITSVDPGVHAAVEHENRGVARRSKALDRLGLPRRSSGEYTTRISPGLGAESDRRRQAGTFSAVGIWYALNSPAGRASITRRPGRRSRIHAASSRAVTRSPLRRREDTDFRQTPRQYRAEVRCRRRHGRRSRVPLQSFCDRKSGEREHDDGENDDAVRKAASASGSVNAPRAVLEKNGSSRGHSEPGGDDAGEDAGHRGHAVTAASRRGHA